MSHTPKTSKTEVLLGKVGNINQVSQWSSILLLGSGDGELTGLLPRRVYLHKYVDT